MIISKIIGGLGNQMFQYAAGKRLSLHRGTTLLLDTSAFTEYRLREYGLDCFSFATNNATDLELRRVLPASGSPLKTAVNALKIWSKSLERPIPLIRERHFNFDPSILELSDNTCLEGYWQSEKYFRDIEPVIRNDFTFRHKPDAENQRILETIRGVNSVGIHIRRGDYVENGRTNEIHGVCSEEYYRRAVERITGSVSTPRYFIFSDDIAWAKKAMSFLSPVSFIDNNVSAHHHEDMRLMANCKHHIIANSSFSWWSAWLNADPNKIVIAPKHWFIDFAKDTRDLIPSDWIRM